jgi:hypothetical protein
MKHFALLLKSLNSGSMVALTICGCQLIWFIYGGGSFMAAACPWQLLVHSSGSFMMAARSWRPLVNGG